jgi:hypothetical protein
MRAAFGLLSLLIGVALMMYLWTQHTAEVSTAMKPAMKEAHQLAGQNEEGVKATDSIKLDPVEKNGKLQYVFVDQITPGGPMEEYYGLKVNDSIIEVGSFDLRGEDGKLAVALIFQEGYQKKQPLTVMRDGEKITLPQQGAARSRPDNRPALQRQLQGIQDSQRIPTH